MDLYTLKSHPAAALFPLLDKDALSELALDIKVHGLRVPPVIWDAGGEWLLLDGRNRVRACQELEMRASAIPHTIYDGRDPVDFVIGANLHRRHLSTSQRAVIALELEKFIHVGQTAQKGERPRDKAGKALGVGGRTVERAKKVAEKSAPAVMDAVKSGKVTVGDAESIVGLPREDQERLVQEVLGGSARNIREAAVAAGYIEEDPNERALTKVVAALHGLKLEQLRHLRDEIDAMIRAQEAA